MLGPIFILVGAGMFAIWLVLRKKAQAISHWTATPGRVVASSIYRHSDTENGGGTEEVLVTYDYAVGGTTLRGNRVSLAGSGSGSTKAKLARYQPGATVDVFYDPRNPSSAVLERKLPGNVLVLPIVGAVFLIAGAVVIV